MKALKEMLIFVVVASLLVGLVSALFWWIGSTEISSSQARCNTIASVSRYPVKFEGSLWSTNHCWIEFSPGVWTDSQGVKLDGR